MKSTKNDLVFYSEGNSTTKRFNNKSIQIGGIGTFHPLGHILVKGTEKC